MSLEALWDSDFCLPVAGFNALHYSSTYFDPKPVFLSGHLLTSYKKFVKIHTIIKPMRDERLKALLNSEESLALKVKITEKQTREIWILQFYRSDCWKTAMEIVTEK